MIRIKPEPEYQAICPKCMVKSVVNETVIQCTFTLADCICESCGFEFYQTLPVSHTIINTLTIGKADGKLYPDTEETWLTKALLRAYHSKRQGNVQIEKIIYKKCDHA